MRIHIIGNIASGKSFLAKKLSESTGFPIFSIDEIRKINNKFSKTSDEKLAWMIFENSLVTHSDCISESTGVSYHWIPMINQAPGIIIKVITPWKKCLKNHKNRVKNENWQSPPMPYTFNLTESLQRNEYLLSKIEADFKYDPENDHEFWSVVLPSIRI